uniref:Polyphosphoinositide phosphatase n=1 Tax=Cacopsylla melanoneura TaxID=428564 RepID=A0A8D8PM46_9HEMI
MILQEGNQKFLPLICPLQKIALYATKTKYLIVGSNNAHTKFRVLKIDRTEPTDLVLVDDKVVYTVEEIKQMTNPMDGNRPRGDASQGGIKKLVSAFGIVGFVRFLEGYYLILVTKRRRVAVINNHTIYKIEDTSMEYIPNQASRITHPDETRYVKMFQSIDLSSNFYFSYSYDITHSLQINMAPPRHISSLTPDKYTSRVDYSHITPQPPSQTSSPDELFPTEPPSNTSVLYGVRTQPNRRFVWNSHLLSSVEQDLHPDWLLFIMHGFVGQSNVSIFGRSVYVTLVARRSNKYAGTRFLKRGANFYGDVANEVETEQIVEDLGLSRSISSFVQMRGSIPAHWSQDITKMVAKPAITLDLNDPFYTAAGAHFNSLLRRYGAPTIILNLVKKREKKKHESQLSEELHSAVNYLNQFLPPDFAIEYLTFDMARMNKGKEANVMWKLADIAQGAISKTGLFCVSKGKGVSYQTGIVRVNCVDCLDRTNTAQFAVGKCALALQLAALGLLPKTSLDFDSDCVRLLEVLYEDHGDTLALQYGGSQLVHRIKTYRKTAPWTSQGNDIMQTLSRYYSNTFSDAEKQHAMNVFLGLFIPEDNAPPIWELPNDYYLHHPQAVGVAPTVYRFPQTQWWDEDVMKCLPQAYDQVEKRCLQVVLPLSEHWECVDVYAAYHRPDELTTLDESYPFKITHSVKDFMPQGVTDFSPFTVRVRDAWRREREANRDNTVVKNPSLTGASSTSSLTSSASSSDLSDDDTSEAYRQGDSKGDSMSKESSVTFEQLFPSTKQVYGVDIQGPDRHNYLIYKRYTLIGKSSSTPISQIGGDDPSSPLLTSIPVLKCLSDFGTQCSESVPVPIVSEESRAIYREYLERLGGAKEPSEQTLDKYRKYCANELYVFS